MHYDEAELLAPAGKWDVLEKVVEAGADAVYIGGKTLNMRMLKSDFNFSHLELKEAVDYLHQRNKKLYITVNNLYDDAEINDVKDYLVFLKDINADALIIQDMGVVQLCNELGLDMALHASVQMGIDNSAAAQFLEEKGFTRAILSKNLSLEEIDAIHQESGLLIEFFAHGDLCISHTGQCYMSSFLQGESGNRGRCIKPCRWKYRLKGTDRFDTPAHLLAHNDLCLYPYLKDLLEAGVRSFKIEGRMRSADYLAPLIKKYRLALDRIIEDSLNYQVDEDELQELNQQRIRDFTSGNLFSRPRIESIGITGEREPFFASSAFKLKRLKPEDYQEIDQKAIENRKPQLSVKVGNIESFRQIRNAGVANIILGYEYFRRDNSGWNEDSINQALSIPGGSGKIILETPRIVSQDDQKLLQSMVNIGKKGGLNGYLVNDYGSLKVLNKSGLPVYGGYGLNITNSRAARFLRENGISRVTASLELGWPELQSLPASGAEMEIMVHGPLCGMITDFCLPQAANDRKGDGCALSCLHSDYYLADEHGQSFKVRTDDKCRNYLYYPYELCLFPFLPALISAGYQNMRIDGQFYSPEILKQITDLYMKALDPLVQAKGEQKKDYLKLLELFPSGLTASPVYLNNN